MSTASTVLNEYAERHTDDEYLGRVCWFSVYELAMPWADLVTILTAHGLEDYAPQQPGDADTFRKVATAAQRKRQDTGTEGQYVNLLVRDVRSDKDTIERRLVVETVDPKGRRLAYEEAYDIVFRRKSATIELNAKMADPPPAAVDVANEIVAGYQAMRGKVDANAIRTLIKRVLDAHHAIAVRPTGGVMFAPEAQANVVESLERIATQIRGAIVHSLPLVDDLKQRDMVRSAVVSSIGDELDQVMTEMRQLLASGEPVTGTQYANLNTTYKQLLARADAYTEVLTDDLDSTRARLAIYGQQQTQLLRLVA